MVAIYLSKFSYTPETWAKLVANPEDRREAAKSYIESVGGTLHGFWYAFGTHDGYNFSPRHCPPVRGDPMSSSGTAAESLEPTPACGRERLRRDLSLDPFA